MRIHFISGLPRSGSTLLAALLSQNPRFHASVSTPIPPILEGMLRNMSYENEAACFISDSQRIGMLQNLFFGYYEPIVREINGSVIFDNHRSWCTRLPLIAQMYPKAKVLCCVRNMASVLNSVEYLLQRNALQPSAIFRYKHPATVYDRVEALMRRDCFVGYAVAAIRQAWATKERERILLVNYGHLTTEPVEVLKTIYAFIGEDYFEHDLNNVSMDAKEFDKHMGTPGLHDVYPVVRPSLAPWVLPRDIIDQYKNFKLID